ncbi:MAG: arylsulfotransferase family protein, partial [bacterium]
MSSEQTEPESRRFINTSFVLFCLVIFAISFVLGSAFTIYVMPKTSLSNLAYHTSNNSTAAGPEKSQNDTKPAGKWVRLPNRNSKSSLQGLGYMAGYKKSDYSGVTLHKPSKAWKGYNFYVSGHNAEALLVDMDGTVLHRWQYSWEKAFPKLESDVHLDKGHPSQDESAGDYWNFAHLYPNGDILATYEEYGLVKLNKDSELLWSKPIRAHHDIWVSPEGKIFTLTLKRKKLEDYRFRTLFRGKHGFIDYVTVLDSSGNVLNEYSVLEAFKRSEFAPLLKLVHKPDVFHTNTLSILQDVPEGMPPEFKAGRALISMRRFNFTGVMDLSKEKIVWGKMTRLQGQHDPSVLPDGDLLIFDNRQRRQASRIVRMDPNRWTVKWELSGEEDVPFYSICCGRNQRLPNGNILVTST